MSKRHAVALRAFTIATQPDATLVEKDDVLLDMDAGQFGGFEGCHLVREATQEEVDAERARRTGKKSKPKKAAPPDADPETDPPADAG